MLNLYCQSFKPPSTGCSDTSVTVFLGICYCVHLFQHTPESSSVQSPLSPQQTTTKEESQQSKRASYKRPVGLTRNSVQRAGSIKDLITRFSGPDHQVSPSGSPQSPIMGAERVQKSASMEALESSKSSPSTPISASQDGSSIPSINVTPPFKETIQNGVGPVQKGSRTTQITSRINFPPGDGAESRSQTNTGRDSVADSGMGSVRDRNKKYTPDRQF